MLKFFYNEFYEWGYIKFNRLNRYIRNIFKETFIAKKIYMGIVNNYIN